MRNLFAWKIASLIALSIWLWLTFVATTPAPDWRAGELYVALPMSELDADAAFEQELVQMFATRLKLRLKPVPLSYNDIPAALANHTVHLAAAGIRKNSFLGLQYSNSYHTMREQLVCQNQTPKRPAQWPPLSIEVVADSPQSFALHELAKRLPNLTWDERYGESASSLLQEVAEGHISCTVANEEQIALARNFYPQLGDAADLATPSNLAWAFAPDVDQALLDETNRFLGTVQKDGTLAHAIDRHYGHNERLEAIDAATFLSNAESLLPTYEAWFKEAAALTGIDWHLLAALAYQESHWDPLATSYTNVRGMMMLTEDTAARMGVTDRLDAQQSILAGAKYLKLMKDALPKRLNDKEAIWMALAAYNQGMGHLEDARILAAKSGLNPDVWSDVKKVMPLLSRPAYYEEAKHGAARGGEAVILVETVRLYHDILHQLDIRQPLHQLPPNLQITLGGYQ